jgi:diaminopimelate decarboxylase
MFTYRHGTMFCENVALKDILRKTGTPAYIYSKSGIMSNYARFDRAFSGQPHLVCYAVKANTNLGVCRTLFSLGAGAEIITGGELYRVLKAGADPSKIVFAGLGKTEEEIKYAARENILMFNAESLEELENLNRISSRTGKRLRVALRVNPNIDPHTHKYITTGKGETKFGIPLQDAPAIYRDSRRYRNLDLCGIHCHIGSQITSVRPFALMARKLAHVVAGLRASGIRLRYIDLGGGLGIRYRDENPPSPAGLAEAVLPALKAAGATLILEPGRYLVGNAGILAAKILYRKANKNKKFLIIDAAMTDLIRPTLYGAYHNIAPVDLKCAGRASGTEKADVVGAVCETGDFIGQGRILPRLEIGEYVAVECAGAYGFSMSSQYNSRPRAAEVLVRGNGWKTVRRRETYRDLITGEKA